jgi:hypothetical protein
VLVAQAFVSKLIVCAPITPCPRMWNIYGGIESVQGLVDSETWSLYSRTVERIARVRVLVAGGLCPLVKAFNVAMTAPR